VHVGERAHRVEEQPGAVPARHLDDGVAPLLPAVDGHPGLRAASRPGGGRLVAHAEELLVDGRRGRAGLVVPVVVHQLVQPALRVDAALHGLRHAHPVPLPGHVLARVHHGVHQALDARPPARVQRGAVGRRRHVEHARGAPVVRPRLPRLDVAPVVDQHGGDGRQEPRPVVHRELEGGAVRHVGAAGADHVAEARREPGRRAVAGPVERHERPLDELGERRVGQLAPGLVRDVEHCIEPRHDSQSRIDPGVMIDTPASH
jgi:hypothetical protein